MFDWLFNKETETAFQKAHSWKRNSEEKKPFKATMAISSIHGILIATYRKTNMPRNADSMTSKL